LNKMENGQVVSVHYVGTFDDGTEFDSSRSRGEPMTFQLGSGHVIPGFDDAVSAMEVGDTQDVHLEPLQAYGEHDPDALQEVPLSQFPGEMELKVDATVYGERDDGGQMMARIIAIGKDTVSLDLNHPMAGKNLNFNIELLSRVN
jgi:FKBP-type peptidyl-prolyl cis-trans isomerase 2